MKRAKGKDAIPKTIKCPAEAAISGRQQRSESQLKTQNLFLCYTLVVGFFSFLLLPVGTPFLDPEIAISLVLFIALLLGNSWAFVALASSISQKRKLAVTRYMLPLLLVNATFSFLAETSFLVDPARLDDIQRLDFRMIGHWSYLANGFLILIFMQAAFRFRFFIPATVLYYAFLNVLLSFELVFFALVIVWSVITGENIYLG